MTALAWLLVIGTLLLGASAAWPGCAANGPAMQVGPSTLPSQPLARADVKAEAHVDATATATANIASPQTGDIASPFERAEVARGWSLAASRPTSQATSQQASQEAHQQAGRDARQVNLEVNAAGNAWPVIATVAICAAAALAALWLWTRRVRRIDRSNARRVAWQIACEPADDRRDELLSRIADVLGPDSPRERAWKRLIGTARISRTSHPHDNQG
jgi:hypothetical protein